MFNAKMQPKQSQKETEINNYYADDAGEDLCCRQADFERSERRTWCQMSMWPINPPLYKRTRDTAIKFIYDLSEMYNGPASLTGHR